MSQKIPALEQVIGLTLLGMGWRWYKDRDKPAGGELMRLLVVASLVVASQPSQPMIALVSDELGMPQN